MVQTKYIALMSPTVLCIMLVLIWNELLFYCEFLACFSTCLPKAIQDGILTSFKNAIMDSKIVSS